MTDLSYLTTKFDHFKGDESMQDYWDTAAVERFGKKMSEKLTVSRAKGRHGWHDPTVISIEFLQEYLSEQFKKEIPDYVDIANFAMMLHFRTEDGPDDK